MLFTLARETGWPRDEILWHMHLAEVVQYRHCALRAAGKWTIAITAPPADQFARLFTNWQSSL